MQYHANPTNLDLSILLYLYLAIQHHDSYPIIEIYIDLTSLFYRDIMPIMRFLPHQNMISLYNRIAQVVAIKEVLTCLPGKVMCTYVGMIVYMCVHLYVLTLRATASSVYRY